MPQARSSTSGETRTAPGGPTPSPDPRWALIAAVVGTSMIFADSTAVNVALPAVARVAGVVAIAVLGIVTSAVVNRSIDSALARQTNMSAATRGVLETQRGAIVSASVSLREVPPGDRARVTRTIVAASARGFSATMVICALLSAAAAALALDKSLSKVNVR